MLSIKQTLHYKPMILTKLVLLLAACGGTGQDDGKRSTFTQTFSGIAIDGYVARSTVFIDSNNNGNRDAWESWAFTDNEGYYSYNPNTDTDYCASDASAQQALYCLRSNTDYSDVVIRIDGGYDILTGEPFSGQLSRKINADNESETQGTVISPITSILADVEDSADRGDLLSALSINESDLDVDYLNTDGAQSVDVTLLNTALKIHKVVAVLSDRLTDTYTEIGENPGVPSDASSAIYPQLAQQIISTGLNLDQALNDTSLLASTLDQAEDALREVYERKDYDLPADMGSASNPGNFQRVINIASEIAPVVDQLIDVDNSSFNIDSALGSSRALETLVIKTIEESSVNDSSIDNAISFFTPDVGDTDAQNLVDTLVATLSLDTADVRSLSDNNFNPTDFDSENEIVEAASLREGVEAFTQIGGLQVRVSDLDLGNRPISANDSEVEFYFSGEPGDIEGAFTACVKHIDDANELTNELGEGSARGELVDGFWSLLGASEGDVESYSLLLTITLLGATYQAIMKPDGTQNISGTEYQRLRFDNDGDFGVWHSELGFVEISNIPSTNEQCRERLPSRLNLD